MYRYKYRSPPHTTNKQVQVGLDDNNRTFLKELMKLLDEIMIQRVE